MMGQEHYCVNDQYAGLLAAWRKEQGTSKMLYHGFVEIMIDLGNGKKDHISCSQCT